MPRGSSLQFGKGTVGRVAPARLSAKKLSGRNYSLATIRLTQSCAIVVINRIPELTPSVFTMACLAASAPHRGMAPELLKASVGPGPEGPSLVHLHHLQCGGLGARW
jgi:hypothetical protein